MAAIDEDGELNRARPSVIHERIECRSDRASRVKNVINEHNVLAFDIEGNIRAMHFGVHARRQIIAVERNIQHADGYLGIFNLMDPIG